MSVFLVDAQLSRKLSRFLTSRGHEASHVYDHLDPQADDRLIADLANRIGASVLSKDADFADLALRGVLSHTLIWLRLPNLTNDGLIRCVERSLPEIATAIERRIQIFEVK